MRILEAYHLADEERTTLQQLALTCQGPGKSVVDYINRWLEMAPTGVKIRLSEVCGLEYAFIVCIMTLECSPSEKTTENSKSCYVHGNY